MWFELVGNNPQLITCNKAVIEARTALEKIDRHSSSAKSAKGKSGRSDLKWDKLLPADVRCQSDTKWARKLTVMVIMRARAGEQNTQGAMRRGQYLAQ